MRHPLASFRTDIMKEALALCSGQAVGDLRSSRVCHLRGVMALRRGLIDLALAYFSRAIRSSSNDATLYNDVGDALLQKGSADFAVAAHLRAVTIAPNDPERYARLGRALHRLRKVQEARASYTLAMRLAPNHADIQGAIGDVLLDQGRPHEAIVGYERSRQLGADESDTRHRLGQAFLSLRRWKDALSEFRCGLARERDRADLHLGRGQAMVRIGMLDEAECAFCAALAIDPTNVIACREWVVLMESLGRRDDAVAAWIGLGTALEAHGRMQDALEVYRQVCARKPECVRALLGLARVNLAMGDAAAAVRQFDAAIAVDPEHAQLHVECGRALQQSGDVERGWTELTWHHYPRGPGWRHGHLPMWDGSRLDGRTVLLWADENTRDVDVIQFLRYVGFALASGGRVVIECDPVLVPLVRVVPGVDEVIAIDGPMPHCDLHAPLLYLPALLPAARSWLTPVPYLRVSDAHERVWRARLRPDSAPVIGIAWGDSTSERQAPAGLSLSMFRSLFARRDLHLTSLQLGPRADEVMGSPSGLAVKRYFSDSPAIVDVAAAVVNVDLVITADPRIAHLAGALGRPVWTLTSRAAAWPWPSSGDQTHVYPTMRLFRQTRGGDWTGALEAVRGALNEELEAVSQS